MITIIIYPLDFNSYIKIANNKIRSCRFTLHYPCFQGFKQAIRAMSRWPKTPCPLTAGGALAIKAVFSSVTIIIQLYHISAI